MTDVFLMTSVGVIFGVLVGQVIWWMFCPEDEQSFVSGFLIIVFIALLLKGVL